MASRLPRPSPRRLLFRSLLLLHLLCGLGVEAANVCYLPNGFQSHDTPCDRYAPVSMCCGTVDGCLSNGLCKDTMTTNSSGNSFARGTCTDATWQSPICPQHCLLNQDTGKVNGAFNFQANGVQVWSCHGQGYGVQDNYCCESASEKMRCCSTPAALFNLPPATPGNALPVQTWAGLTSGGAGGAAATAARTHATTATTPNAAAQATAGAPPTAPTTSGASRTAAHTTTAVKPSTNKATPSRPQPMPAATPFPAASTGAYIYPLPVAGRPATPLSTGTLVAIGVATSLVSAIMVGSAVMFILRRTKPYPVVTRWTGSGPQPPPPPPHYYGGSPLMAKSLLSRTDSSKGVDEYSLSAPSSTYGRRDALGGMERIVVPVAKMRSQGTGFYASPPTSPAEKQRLSPTVRMMNRPPMKVYELA